MNYRFSIANTIINDIFRGLGGDLMARRQFDQEENRLEYGHLFVPGAGL